MVKINRMTYCGGIIRDENMAIVNHNKSVDKINELIDALNTSSGQAEREKEHRVVNLEVDYSDIIANLKLISQNLLNIDEWGKGVSITNPGMMYVFNEFIAPAVESLLAGIKAMEKINIQKEIR